MTKTPVLKSSVTTAGEKNIFQEDSEKSAGDIFASPQKRREPVNWDQELHWFQENQWVFEKYKGRWIAIKGQKLVAHHIDYQKLQTFCRENNIEDPFMQYIPTSKHEWDLGVSNYVVLSNSANNI